MKNLVGLILILSLFSDGKFILELARSKDGDKSGWISVPREDNSIPSPARSSTIIPSASIAGATQSLLAASPAALTGGVGFPKNECSNSLSCKSLVFHINFLYKSIYAQIISSLYLQFQMITALYNHHHGNGIIAGNK